MNNLKPKILKKGDTVGFLSVSGNIEDISRLDKAKEYFENRGYRVKISETSYKKKDYLCGTDKERADALNSFFQDPKIFCGYSDITAFSVMAYKKTGLVTYSAPMAYSDFGNGISANKISDKISASRISNFTAEPFFSLLEGRLSEIIIDEPKVFSHGNVQGTLWGGNLSTIQSLCGLYFVPDENFIFVTEDINEPGYKIDKMFTQLLNLPLFKKNLKAVVLGDFSGIDNQIYFDNFFSELAQNVQIPVIGGLKFGHEKDKKSLPIGVPCTLDTSLGKLLI
jgi:muramoyltetrapeptide carboxypeptidase